MRCRDRKLHPLPQTPSAAAAGVAEADEDEADEDASKQLRRHSLQLVQW